MAGVSRLPALCFGNLHSTMESSNLGNYEVSPVEPLHDLKGHIKNVWELLPNHMTPEIKKIFVDEVHLALGNKLNKLL